MDIKYMLSAAVAAFTIMATAAVPEGERTFTPGGTLQPAPRENYNGTRTLPLRTDTRNATSPKAAFTVADSTALAPVLSQNFDTADPDGWQFDAPGDVAWTIKQAGAPGSSRSFSNINPADVSSLFVEGPYQTFKRTKASAYSPVVTIPANGTLTFYTGFSRNYDEQCRLYLDLINGVDTVALWNSSEAPGDKPWAWRKVTLSLEQYAGKDVKFIFTYGPGSADSFGVGGYMGDFFIDDFIISGMRPVESVSVLTGETISLVDLSEGRPVQWEWSFPGAVPSSSTERNPQIYYTKAGLYDVSLTVKDGNGNSNTCTRKGFVSVSGQAPVARIIPPALFRSSTTRRHIVAPLAPVTYTDGSTGFPQTYEWKFSGVNPDLTTFESTDTNPVVSYSYLHNQIVKLRVTNDVDTDTTSCDVSVEYSAVVNNMLPSDKLVTFDMQDWGIFPGSNTRKITAYAERFSKPSRPIMIDGAYVYFVTVKATDVADQIANVGVHLYTSENGKPGKRLDSMWWSVFELDLPGSTGQLVGTAFPFTESPIVDDEFFIVVDGLPEFSETCCVSFGMADFRPSGNSALMLKDGKWMEVPEYFGNGKGTSYMIYPSVHHSVMSPLPAGSATSFTVGKEAGTIPFHLFSYMGYRTPADIDNDWMRITSTPNGLTVDTLTIAYDALPDGITKRTGHITLTDGASQLTVTLMQDKNKGVSSTLTAPDSLAATPSPFADSFEVTGINPGERLSIYSPDGKLMTSRITMHATESVDGAAWPAGVYILRCGARALRIVKK